MTWVDAVDGVNCKRAACRGGRGYCHTLVQTLEGKLLAMGYGDDEPGESTRDVVNSVSFPNVEKVVRIATGANHSVMLGESGTAYTFGADDVG